MDPIKITYRNPEMKARQDAAHFWEDDPDPALSDSRSAYLDSIDSMIARADEERRNGFPPVPACPIKQ